MSRAAQLADGAARSGCGLLALLILAAFGAFADPAGAATLPASPVVSSAEPLEPVQAAAAPRAGGVPARAGAGISIVGGRATTIANWPWQVALTATRALAPRLKPSQRFFCGGTLLTPRVVITAAHCVAHLNGRQIRQIDVISGRTRLNAPGGQITRVAGLRMPRNAAGKRLFKGGGIAASWDVALLLLRAPVRAEPIRIAGPDEERTTVPGQVAWTTGWGVARAFAQRIPAQLRVAQQVIMDDRLCRRVEGVAFRPLTMTCLGGPGGNASTCSGDSGGPLVVRTSDGFRLVGLTSFGDGACRGFIPSVDTRVSGAAIRNWVQSTVAALTGQDVVGSGGVAAPIRTWCRIPAVFRLFPGQARRRLAAAGCRLGKVRVDRWSVGPRGRIVGYTRLPGWLAPPGFRLDVWVAP